jgi:hypothetical protein
MNEIEGREKRDAVLNAIGGCPRGLEDMIQRVFDRLYLDESVDKDDLKEILMWFGYSKRALCVAELYAILEARTGHTYDALERRIRGKFAFLFAVTGFEESQVAPFDIHGKLEDLEESDLDLSDSETSHDLHGSGELSSPEELNESARLRLWKAQVRFTHESIRDFVVSPRFIKYYTTLFGPVPDRGPADFQMAMSSMQMIPKSQPGRTKACNVDDSSGNYFMDHLLSVDENHVNQEPRNHSSNTYANCFTMPKVSRNLSISQDIVATK